MELRVFEDKFADKMSVNWAKVNYRDKTKKTENFREFSNF